MLLGLGHNIKVDGIVTRGAGLLILVLCVIVSWGTSVMASVLLSDASLNVTETTPKLLSQRLLYKEALTELRTGMGPRYRAIREQLSDYPLVQYLDYEALVGQIHTLEPREAQAFLSGFRFRVFLPHKHQSVNHCGDKVERQLVLPFPLELVVQYPADDPAQNQAGRP